MATQFLAQDNFEYRGKRYVKGVTYIIEDDKDEDAFRQLAQVMPAMIGAVSTVPDTYDVFGSAAGVPAASAVVLHFVANRSLTFPAGMVGSRGVARAAATAAASFNLQKNGTTFGTMAFAAAGTVATFTASTATSFVAGDVLTVVAPGVADTTLSGLAMNLAGVSTVA